VGACANRYFRRWLYCNVFTLGARVAGHTFIIGAIQSGLHGLRPGGKPDWSAEEGIAEGPATAPVRAHESGIFEPHTITCFKGEVPEKWFSR